MIFPCAVHKDNYDNSRIAANADELEALRADGWITSDEWYKTVLGIGVDEAEEPVKRGRKAKTENVETE